MSTFFIPAGQELTNMFSIPSTCQLSNFTFTEKKDIFSSTYTLTEKKTLGVYDLYELLVNQARIEDFEIDILVFDRYKDVIYKSKRGLTSSFEKFLFDILEKVEIKNIRILKEKIKNISDIKDPEANTMILGSNFAHIVWDGMHTVKRNFRLIVKTGVKSETSEVNLILDRLEKFIEIFDQAVPTRPC